MRREGKSKTEKVNSSHASCERSLELLIRGDRGDVVEVGGGVDVGVVDDGVVDVVDPPRARSFSAFGGMPETLAIATVTALAMTFVLTVLWAGPSRAEPTAEVSRDLIASPPASFLSPSETEPGAGLAALLSVPGRSDAEWADLSIAAAVARGTNPELILKSGFRKHSFDLIRTERDIKIGERDMKVRFRLRAKKRNTVSVQLRF